jgi:Outer membrane protein beta-barrel domain
MDEPTTAVFDLDLPFAREPMRRSPSLLNVALVSLAATSFAATRPALAQQAPRATPVRLGLEGGPSAANFGGTDADLRHRTAALFGGYAVLDVSGRIAMQPELLFSMKGAHEHRIVNSPNGPVPATYTTNADYVELPVLARVVIAPARRSTPYLLGGPAVAMRAACATAQTGVVEVGRSSSCGDAVRRVDAGVVLGAGVTVGGVGAGALNVGARYEAGLVRIAHDSPARNRVLSITVGFEASIPP